MSSLPTDDKERGLYPMAEGLLDYFPNALAEVSRISYEGNQKHNPGEPMHWSRGKSTDHRNKIVRHTVDSVTEDEEGIEHAAQAAWRSLANLQEKIERVRNVPMSAGSKPTEEAEKDITVFPRKLIGLRPRSGMWGAKPGFVYRITHGPNSENFYTVAGDGRIYGRRVGENGTGCENDIWDAVYEGEK